ncbi:hypothetical protein [Methylomonas rapida]|uniref:CopG family transcriptional regulator n=1 Tax=Methylomonas rapida TaxID=2963939 RepID=A0ABY7GJE9_9GAMM|nr:hypothetical protein [Methylomonas rapida]WAR44575.1 hypothetical protein NM686_019850 [Methylomonas rapida]
MNIPFNEFLEDEASLPPRMENKAALSKERNFRTALSAANYMLLEKEATQRGIKPFTLTKSVMTLYIHRQLIYIKELPKELQDAITLHYSNVDRLNLAEDL